MSDIKERITVEGNFKEQVQAFVNGLIKARMEFKNLIIGVSTGSRNINQTMTLAQRKIDRYASQLIKEGETVENAIKKDLITISGHANYDEYVQRSRSQYEKIAKRQQKDLQELIQQLIS